MFANSRLALTLATKTILRGDKGSFILTIVIMLVVFLNLLFVDAIFAGITRTIDRGKIDYQYGEVIIEPAPGEKYIKETNHIIDAIRDYDFVKSITHRIIASAVLSHDRDRDGRDVVYLPTSIVGIDPDIDAQSIPLHSTMIDGRYLRAGDYGKAILGADAAGGYGSSVFASDLEGVRSGDTITATFANGIVREYDIVGIYRTKNFEMDARMFVLDDDLDTVLGTTNESSEIILRLDNREQSSDAVRMIRALKLGDFTMADWHEKLSFGRTISESFEKIGSLLRIIGSLVAGLIIFIIIFVDIVNRRKQIGILKAIGIPERVIVYSYLMRGMFYTVCGMLLGYLLMRYGVIGFFHKHPIDFPMGLMVPYIVPSALYTGMVLFALAGMVGSFLPAIKEVRRAILELMR